MSQPWITNTATVDLSTVVVHRKRPNKRGGRGKGCPKDCICLCHQGQDRAHIGRRCKELSNAEKIASAVKP